MTGSWMIYGANGYTGELIAREAVKQGMTPILAGRSEEKVQALARELNLESRVFSLDQNVSSHLAGIRLVLHCAGPFQKTSAPMIEGCLAASAHYLDITGEISVFEHTHAQHERAAAAGIVLCSGAGFDVIPTDCTALRLKELLPEATQLALGFDSDSGASRGTLKTMISGLGSGSAERRDGQLIPVPLGSQARTIDFGRGFKSAMGIPWGDVSTAFFTTGIPNISTWIPMPKNRVRGARLASVARPLLNSSFVKHRLQKLIERKVTGPSETSRMQNPAFIWGEAVNSAGTALIVRIRTANVYDVTVFGALEMTARLRQHEFTGGSYTPALLFGSSFIEQLPGSGSFQVFWT
ncbi:saccharopine dehydrogenase family protein [Planococcus lenghuensis]|nr:saccharopine dehydrogenase NADP-binding domain-containing protein [Planococcus lenghuensis]